MPYNTVIRESSTYKIQSFPNKVLTMSSSTPAALRTLATTAATKATTAAATTTNTATRRLQQLQKTLSPPTATPKTKMTNYTRKHKVTVIGSGNWYVLCSPLAPSRGDHRNLDGRCAVGPDPPPQLLNAAGTTPRSCPPPQNHMLTPL